MNILAIDPGTRLGWALQEGRYAKPIFGLQKFEIARDESPGMRWLRFRSWLIEIEKHSGGIDVIYHERPHHRGGAATAVLEGFVSHLQSFAADNNIEIKAVHSGTIKKFSTGKGNAGKPEMIAAAQRFYPDEPPITDDNIADALMLLALARREIGI